MAFLILAPSPTITPSIITELTTSDPFSIFTLGASTDPVTVAPCIIHPPAIRESTKVVFDINGERFKTTGSRTIEKNWLQFYGRFAKLEEVEIPEVKKGQKIKVNELTVNAKETQPPARYSQGSIVKELEDVKRVNQVH